MLSCTPTLGVSENEGYNDRPSGGCLAPSTVVLEIVESKVLAGNPLGDAHVRELPVYLPPGYPQGSTRYPVIYLLAGFTSFGQAFLHRRPWEENIQQRVDRLIAQGLMRPMIVVLPDCFTRYGGSQYINSSATGHYADHLIELMDVVDTRFRTIADRLHRAIAGYSSGGFGALTMAMHRPEDFALVADHSGDKYFELCYKADFPAFLRAAARYPPLQNLLANPGQVRPRGSDFHALMNVLAMSACYSPNQEAPLGFDLPLDLETGELRQDVWQRWLAHDPVEQVQCHADALRSLQLLYFDCGNQDEFNMHYGCRILQHRLRHLGIDHRYEEYEGSHTSFLHRLDVSFGAISDAMPN